MKITTGACNCGLVYRVLVFTAFLHIRSVSRMPGQMLGTCFLLQNKEESVCKQTLSFQGTAQQQVGTKNVISAGWGLQHFLTDPRGMYLIIPLMKDR